MTLGFLQQIENKPNYFIQKIWLGLMAFNVANISDYQNYRSDFNNFLGKDWDDEPEILSPKIHTIRIGERWDNDKKIHFVINNRTKKRFQFAPLINCKSVQDAFMTYHQGKFEVSIDDRYIYLPEMETLAVNDGFETLESFKNYFIKAMDKDLKLSAQLIHWTNLKY